MQRLPGIDDPVVLLDDNGMDLEEANILEGLPRAIFAAGSDDMGAD
jgi:hypothetical protein